jgi:micrococcal nuclease
MSKLGFGVALAAMGSIGTMVGLALPAKWKPGGAEPVAVAAPASSTTLVSARTFSICHTGGGINCVVDGDTAWIDGEKVRIADIDAPETHPPRCESEADLGNRATARLAELMNNGAFELKVIDRDEDRYGRKLRVLVRGGKSLGDQLVSEGLARAWDGRRGPWC